MRRLPPLSQLRAFEAAARHCSFKLAADELAVTPAAISHHVRELEQRLGVSLFARKTRQVLLTSAGLRLYPAIRDSFDGIANALTTLQGVADKTPVTLALTPAFATQWLLPRMAAFEREHADIDLRILASEQPVNLHQGDAHIAVRYGGATPAQHQSLLLAQDRFIAVASPSLGLRNATQLRQHRLLHFQWSRPSSTRPTWQRWLDKAGMQHADAVDGLQFGAELGMLQAAIAGHGVALCSRTLAQQALAAGQLHQPFGPTLPAPTWRLLRSKRQPEQAASRRVWAWLAAQFNHPLG